MDTQLETPTSSFVYHRIPTQVSRKDFNRDIKPHLKRPKTGPKPKLSLYKIFDTVHFPFVLCGHFQDGFFLERDMSFSEVMFV